MPKKTPSKSKHPFSNSNLYLVGKGKDTNGNAIVKLSFREGRGFSIQTNGNLPKTHSFLTGYTNPELKSELKKNGLSAGIEKEIFDYVSQYGSDAQKEKLKKK